MEANHYLFIFCYFCCKSMLHLFCIYTPFAESDVPPPLIPPLRLFIKLKPLIWNECSKVWHLSTGVSQIPAERSSFLWTKYLSSANFPVAQDRTLKNCKYRSLRLPSLSAAYWDFRVTARGDGGSTSRRSLLTRYLSIFAPLLMLLFPLLQKAKHWKLSLSHSS